MRDDARCVRERARSVPVPIELHLNHGERILDRARLVRRLPEADWTIGRDDNHAPAIGQRGLLRVTKVVSERVGCADTADWLVLLQLLEQLVCPLSLERGDQSFSLRIRRPPVYVHFDDTLPGPIFR